MLLNATWYDLSPLLSLVRAQCPQSVLVDGEDREASIILPINTIYLLPCNYTTSNFNPLDSKNSKELNYPLGCRSIPYGRACIFRLFEP